MIKDLIDCLVRKDKIGFSFVKTKLIDECIFVVFSLKQVRETKRKRLYTQIKEEDAKLSDLIAEAMEEKLLKTDKISKLVKYTKKLLGGKRKKKWTLKSGLDL